MTISNDTTFSIYRIVCFSTADVYIGQSDNPPARLKRHFRDLRSGKHPNPHLQRAYQKYGREFFYSEILEKNIPSDVINEREIYWINYFDAFRNGFNRTCGGDKPPSQAIACFWNGKWWASIAEAARSVGISTTSMKHRISKGYVCDDDVPVPGTRISKLWIWNGVAYQSISAAARANNVNVGSMNARFAKGYTSDADLKPNGHPIIYNGIQYPSIGGAARANNLSETAMRRRIGKGCFSDRESRQILKPWSKHHVK